MARARALEGRQPTRRRAAAPYVDAARRFCCRGQSLLANLASGRALLAGRWAVPEPRGRGVSSDCGRSSPSSLARFRRDARCAARRTGWSLVDASRPAEADRVFARLLKDHPASPHAADARFNWRKRPPGPQMASRPPGYSLRWPRACSSPLRPWDLQTSSPSADRLSLPADVKRPAFCRLYLAWPWKDPGRGQWDRQPPRYPGSAGGGVPAKESRSPARPASFLRRGGLSAPASATVADSRLHRPGAEPERAKDLLASGRLVRLEQVRQLAQPSRSGRTRSPPFDPKRCGAS